VACSNYQGFPTALHANKCVQGDATAKFPLKVRWCREFELPVTGTPKAQDGVLYVRTSDNLSKAVFYAVDAETSDVIWQIDTPAAMGEPLYHWNVVGDYLVVSGINKVQAVNRHTGQIAWQRSIPSSGEVLVANQDLYMVTTGSLFHMSTSDGQTLWEFKGLPSHRTFRGFFIPDNSTIVVPADDYYVIDAVSGRLSYESAYDFLAGPRSAVPHQNKLVYGNMIIEAANGKVVKNLPGGNADSTPLVNLEWYLD
jgi:outer membrane protein assembly factor BamB